MLSSDGMGIWTQKKHPLYLAINGRPKFITPGPVSFSSFDCKGSIASQNSIRFCFAFAGFQSLG